MLKSFDKYPFPRETDLAGIVESVPSGQLDADLRRNGVILVAKKEDKAGLLARFSFHESWYAKSIAEPVKASNGIQIMGLELPIQDLSAVLVCLERRRSSLNAYKTSKHRPKIVQVGTQEGPHGYLIRVEYVQLRSLRTEFFRRERHEFGFYVGLAPNKSVELLSIVDSSSDGAVARDVFIGIQKDMTIEATPPRLEDLDATSRVNVFKAVFALSETGHWRSREVRALKIRRYTAEGRTEEKEIDEADTSRLTSAIFKGKQIDEDDYVKQLMSQGYFFRSADLITFNPGMNATGREVVVTINFSENPNVLLVSAREHAGDGSSVTAGPIAEDELVGIAEYFWRKTYQFLNAEHDKLKKSGKPAGRDASTGVSGSSVPSPGLPAPPPSGTSAP